MAASEIIDFMDTAALDVYARTAEVVTWNGRRALRLEDGLALLRGLELADAEVELDMGVDAGPAYPGLAFRAADPENYELIYTQPHTSGGWDALQYDPVFRGSNTWQLFHGPCYQGSTEVPSGRWFTLTVRMDGPRAFAWVDRQAAPELAVARLAHGRGCGQIGVWTYRPAYFAQVRIGSASPALPAGRARVPALPPHAVTGWLLEGHGPVRAEDNGTVNLNRYLRQDGQREAVLLRDFTAAGQVVLRFGFSDDLRLFLDGTEVFVGTNRFRGMGGRAERGYVEPGAHTATVEVGAGRHRLEAHLAAAEPFGWGLALSIAGADVALLPAAAASTPGWPDLAQTGKTRE